MSQESTTCAPDSKFILKAKQKSEISQNSNFMIDAL